MIRSLIGVDVKQMALCALSCGYKVLYAIWAGAKWLIYEVRASTSMHTICDTTRISQPGQCDEDG